MVFGPARWNGVSKSREFGQVCAGYNKEENFWNFEESIPNLREDIIFLDIGCGPGRIASFVIPKVKAYYGIDIHPELIGIAEEHYKDYPNVFFAKNDGHGMSMFKDDYFDYVYERLMFIHIPKDNIIEYLLDSYRVLKLGGFLYVPDLPRDKFWINGFTREEICSVLNKFSNVKIGNVGNTWQLECIK